MNRTTTTNRMRQQDLVLFILAKGYTLTPAEAEQLVHTRRLGGLVFKIRRGAEAPWGPIAVETQDVTHHPLPDDTAIGRLLPRSQGTYARYWIKQENRQAAMTKLVDHFGLEAMGVLDSHMAGRGINRLLTTYQAGLETIHDLAQYEGA